MRVHADVYYAIMWPRKASMQLHPSIYSRAVQAVSYHWVCHGF